MTNESISPRTWQACLHCGHEASELNASARCEKCHDLWEVRHRAPEQSGALLRVLFDTRRGVSVGPAASGVWRFRELVLPSAGDVPVIVLTAKDLSAEDRRRLNGQVKKIMAKGEGIESVLKKVQELVAQSVVPARAA